MADKPFDRTIINPRERPLSSDINQAQAQVDRALRFMFERLLGGRTSDASQLLAPVTGFIGDGFQVVPDSPVGMVVDIKAGLGFINDPADVPVAIDGVVGLDDRQPYKPVLLLADATFAVPTAPGANDRTDIIEVKVGRRTENPLSREILDLTSGQFVPDSVNKTLAFSHDGKTGTVNAPSDSTAELSYKVGVVGAPGAVPATTTGYVKVAEIFVDTGVVTIDGLAIVDTRKLLTPGNVQHVSAQFRVEYNGGGGAERITMRNVIAPPGMHVAVSAFPTMGEGEIFVLGGDFTKIVGSIIGNPNSVIGVAQIILCYLRTTLDAPGVLGAITAGEQTQLDTAPATDPNVQVGIGQTRANFTFQSRFQSAGATNNTDALLEDLEMHFQAWMSW